MDNQTFSVIERYAYRPFLPLYKIAFDDDDNDDD
jgi:hypothetical protein